MTGWANYHSIFRVVMERSRKYSVAPLTYYSWKAKFGGMSVSEVQRLKALEEE